MKSCSVDKLAESLSTLAAVAQKQMIDDRKRLSATIDMDAEGTPKYVTWECKVPSGDGRERQHSLLKIPWESFYEDEPMSITEMSVEFGCTIHKETARDAIEHYILKPKNTGNKNTFDKRTTGSGHIFKLILNDENAFSPEISIDGQRCDEYFEQNKQAAYKKSATPHFIAEGVNQIITLFKRLFSWL
jgi:hypothetical protein